MKMRWSIERHDKGAVGSPHSAPLLRFFDITTTQRNNCSPFNNHSHLPGRIVDSIKYQAQVQQLYFAFPIFSHLFPDTFLSQEFFRS